MTINQVPSATGVRIAGDNYQWLHVWRCCMEALHQNLTGNAANPIIEVGIEVADSGNADDVVLYRQASPNTYIQVKYAVDHRTAVNLDYLDKQQILRDLVQAHAELTRDGTPVEIRLVTNRTPDPGDVIVAGRDARDGRLLPRADQGGPRSARGKARAAWAAAAGTDEASLMSFLSDLDLDLAYDLRRLRADVALSMAANGLRSDDLAVGMGADWVAARVIAGYRRVALTDIKDAVRALQLEAGRPWTTISIATAEHDHVADQAAVSIDWVDRMSGDTSWTRIAPTPPHTWDDLAAEIRTIPSRLDKSTRVLVGGHIRQATGFLVGSELRLVLGYEVGIQQRDQLWTAREPVARDAVRATEREGPGGSDTALIVNVAANGADDACDWIHRSGLPIGRIVVAESVAGIGPSAVPDAAAANSLAVGIRDLARRHAAGGNLHLFLIGPLGLAVLLGHHWSRVTTTHVYEHLGGAEYGHAFTVDA